MSDTPSSETDREGQRSATSDPEERALDLDAIFDLLSERWRRHVLYYLTESTGTVALTELTEGVLASATGEPPDAIPDDRYNSLLCDLHHAHLPALADAGVVDYYPDLRLVVHSGDLGALDRWLRRTAQYERWETVE